MHEMTKQTRKRYWSLSAILLGGTLAAGATAQHIVSSPGDVDVTHADVAVPSVPVPIVKSENGVSFKARVDRTAVMVGQPGHVRMQLSMKADADGEPVRVPTDLVIVLDRSGSMSGSKMQYARAAVHQLISQLAVEDRFALVTYSHWASSAIPLSFAHPSAVNSWFRRVNTITANGGTNMSHGMDVALNLIDRVRQADRAARVILISDGLANEGDSSFTGLYNRARRASRGEYVLSTVGVGRDFNEELMTSLADAGTGNYYFLHSGFGLANVFRAELESTRETVATALAVAVQPGEGVQVVDAGGYPLENSARGILFRPGTLFAGQERKVWVTLRVPTGSESSFDVGRVTLHFKQGASEREISIGDLPQVACVQDREVYLAAIDADVWEQAVAQDEYNELQWNVARMVRKGDQAKALREIDTFRARNHSLNLAFDSDAVEGALRSAAQLEDDVNGAFIGPNQAVRQQELSKDRGESGYVGRRAGARR